jgi:hypothetical protein
MTDKVTGKVMYKTGHTKWGPANFTKRFEDEEYSTFDIELLSNIMFSHPDWKVAKAVIITIENMIRAIIPAKDPSFMIEDYFGREPGTMKISGVTELIFLKENQTEDKLVSVFNRFKGAATKTAFELQEKL